MATITTDANVFYPTIRAYRIDGFAGTETVVDWTHQVNGQAHAKFCVFSRAAASNDLDTVIERLNETQLRLKRAGGSAFPSGSDFEVVGVSDVFDSQQDIYVKAQAGPITQVNKP